MQVECIDHVHIEVRDRAQAAIWYARVLGLSPHPDLIEWSNHPKGPLILAGADGRPALALFERQAREISRDTTTAFRVSGANFRILLEKLDVLMLRDKFGQIISREHVVDHDLSWSIYFTDPDLNPIEITTYDRNAVG
jgi:catechol-2,3-dioxygenase